MRLGYVLHWEGIEAAMVGTQHLGVRAAIPARLAPLLLYAVGAADGFAQRAIRRACGGRESAGLYHRTKYLQVVVLGLSGVGLLLWPGPARRELGVLLAGGVVGTMADRAHAADQSAAAGCPRYPAAQSDLTMWGKPWRGLAAVAQGCKVTRAIMSWDGGSVNRIHARLFVMTKELLVSRSGPIK